jgi:hypothetical protein
MFKVERHLWRTADGRLVQGGHPDAAVLAYTAGQEVPDDIARRDGLLPVKSKAKPADKAAARPADKAAGGGATSRKEEQAP